MPDKDETADWWKAPVAFGVEAGASTIVFFVIAAAAVGLSFFVQWLKSYHVEQLVILGLEGAEYALFLVDLLLFGRFLWRAVERNWDRL